jgi:hypothetical protein
MEQQINLQRGGLLVLLGLLLFVTVIAHFLLLITATEHTIDINYTPNLLMTRSVTAAASCLSWPASSSCPSWPTSFCHRRRLFPVPHHCNRTHVRYKLYAKFTNDEEDDGGCFLTAPFLVTPVPLASLLFDAVINRFFLLITASNNTH